MAWSSLFTFTNKVCKETPNCDLKTRITSADVATLRKQLTVLTKAGIIEESKETKPSSQAPIIKRVRFCRDYQYFNQRTLPKLYNDWYIEKGLNCLVGYQIYSVVSVLSRISQLPQYPGERDLPYTVRPYGFYECERMQSGYCQDLADYQKLMEGIVSDLSDELLVYMDYIIIFTNCLSEHMTCLDKVFGRLKALGFTIIRDESLYCCPLVMYAGHLVSSKGISIADDKKRVLAKWPKPRTVSELQCYVDFCTYYRQFVSDFQDLAKPLNEILQEAADHKAKNPGGPWWATESIEERWTEECDKAFYGLKDRLLQEKVLPRANMSQPEASHVETEEQPD